MLLVHCRQTRLQVSDFIHVNRIIRCIALKCSLFTSLSDANKWMNEMKWMNSILPQTFCGTCPVSNMSFVYIIRHFATGVLGQRRVTLSLKSVALRHLVSLNNISAPARGASASMSAQCAYISASQFFSRQSSKPNFFRSLMSRFGIKWKWIWPCSVAFVNQSINHQSYNANVKPYLEALAEVLLCLTDVTFESGVSCVSSRVINFKREI